MTSSCTVLQTTESFPLHGDLEKFAEKEYTNANAGFGQVVDQSHARFSRKELKTRFKGVGKGRPLGINDSISLGASGVGDGKMIWNSKTFLGQLENETSCRPELSMKVVLKATESASAHSYAAAVIGRKGGDLTKLMWESEETGFLSDRIVSEGSIVEGAKSLSVPKKTRDIGIQVGPEARSLGTMTSSKGLYKSKSVSAKLCCSDEKVENASGMPPIEFIGDQFTFTNALADTVAKMGIKFFY